MFSFVQRLWAVHWDWDREKPRQQRAKRTTDNRADTEVSKDCAALYRAPPRKLHPQSSTHKAPPTKLHQQSANSVGARVYCVCMCGCAWVCIVCIVCIDVCVCVCTLCALMCVCVCMGVHCVHWCVRVCVCIGGIWLNSCAGEYQYTPCYLPSSGPARSFQ